MTDTEAMVVALKSRASFHDDRMQKVDLVRSSRMFGGLNCFRRGQSQPVHTHPHADKFYLVLTGKARMVVGSTEHEAAPGTLVWAPAGVPHGVAEALEDAVLLVVMVPPPTARD